MVRRIAVLVSLVVLVLGSAGCGSNSSGTVRDSCSPAGLAAAVGRPKNLDTGGAAAPDRYTTPGVVPLNRIDIGKLGLITPGVLSVGTLSDAAPGVCVNHEGVFTGADNELLNAVATKLRLRVKFSGTDFAGLLAEVADRRFDVASASVTSTEARRKLVGFTNGYDFAYLALVVPAGSGITTFTDLGNHHRIGVVQGSVQQDYVVNTLHLDPVVFTDYTTLYASLKTGQIDAWVAPSSQAKATIKPGDPVSTLAYTYSTGNFVAWAVAPANQPLIDALNSGLDAIIADGTYAKIYSDWQVRPFPPGWKPGSAAAPMPIMPDFDAIAASHPATHSAGRPPSTLTQLRDTFFDWSLYRQAIPTLFETGLPNTLILALCSGVLGTLLGMLLAVAGLARTRWLRWPARIYTDIFRGLPAVVTILIIGLGVGPLVRNLTGGNPYWLGAIALALLAAAYIGEIFRSGIQSVEPGQLEAARAIGFSHGKAMRLVVIPQGVRRVLPALVNQFIVLIKDSSLIYFLGLMATQRELFAVGRDLNAETGNLSPLVAAGLFYLALTVPLTHFVNYIDKRLRTGRTVRVEADE